MIKLNRNLDPASFPASFTDVTRKDWELELLQDYRRYKKGDIEKLKFKSARWKQAKENLLLESNNKCAYCEANFSTVAYGDVEHYRPKSIYWWLAYSYVNYSASCQLCNQKYKKAKFPISNSKWRGPYVRKNTTNPYLNRIAGFVTVDPLDDLAGLRFNEFVQKHNSERPESIDPYLDNPEDYFKFSKNDLTREIFIEPLNAQVDDIASSAIDLFGLNRKELRDLRYRGFFLYRFIRNVAENDSDADVRLGAKNVIASEFLDIKVEFCGMYRYFETLPYNDLLAV